jgi:hypothetical protein
MVPTLSERLSEAILGMPESLQILLGILFLIAVYVLTRFGEAWRIRRASLFIIRDLEKRKAFDPEGAAELLYAKKDLFRMGMRDFKPRALESLVHDGILGKTESGRYYLKKRLDDLKTIVS